MGRNQVEGDMIFADVDYGGGGYYENGVSVQQQQMHRKHRRKKGDNNIVNDGGAVVTNGDVDIVTPYQNGHYTNGYQQNHHNPRPRLVHRHSSFSGADDDGEEEAQVKTGYGDYLSPSPAPHLPLQHLLLDDQRGVGGQSSVNNAITVAPSRLNLNDSNVFAGGRPSNLSKRPNHRNNNRHNKHKSRSRTPDFTTSSNHRLRLDEEPHDSQSILNRIDLSIRKNFGDWDKDESSSEIIKKPGLNGVSNGYANGKPQKVPFFIPKNVASDSDVVGLMGGGGDGLNLPRLFKPYDSEVSTSMKVLNDKSYKVCLSRDNDDPNSILSQAKKTLNFVSGQS